jgi:hypothetical protein
MSSQEEAHKYQPPSNEAITEQAEALCKGMYENHEANLNQWAAEFLGYVDDTRGFYKVGDAKGTLYLYEQWNPCQDRNQCWLVVDKMFELMDNEGGEYDTFHTFVKELTGWVTVPIAALRNTPKEILEAARKAVQE